MGVGRVAGVAFVVLLWIVIEGEFLVHPQWVVLGQPSWVWSVGLFFAAILSIWSVDQQLEDSDA